MQSKSDASADRLLRALVTVVRGAKRTRGENPGDGGSGWLLHVLDCRGPQRLTDLATASGLDASTASRHARTLEDKGLLERSPDPADGRAHQLAVTDAGRQHLAELWDRRRENMAGYLADWSEADVTTLTDLLERLAEQISPTHDHDRKPA